MILAIDPGISGALAIYDQQARLLYTVIDMPILPIKGGKNRVNAYMLGQFIKREADKIDFAVVEQVGSMPGQGVTSMFNFGMSYGVLIGALAAHEIKTAFVTPAKWKRAVGLTKDKGVSREMATRRFPSHAHLFARVKDDGRAEAALLALYASQDRLGLGMM